MEKENGAAESSGAEIEVLQAGNQETEGKKTPQFIAAIAATLAAAAAGTALAWTSPANPMLPFSDQQKSWIGSLLSVGAIPGAVVAGTMTQALGRKPAIATLALPFIVSYIIIACSLNLWAIYTARLISGLGVGGVVVAVPIYVAEIAENSVRGTLGSLLQVMFNLGILFANAVGAARHYSALAWSCGATAIIFLAVFIFMPETPQYLLSVGHTDDALSALRWLRGKESVSVELASMAEIVEKSARERTSLRAVLSTTTMRRALILSVGLVIIQQLSGINVVFFYTQSIFEAAGSTMSPSTCAIIVAVVMLIFSQIAAPLSDRAGRRALLIASALGMAVSLSTLGGYFHAKTVMGDDAVKSVFWLPLASVIAYMCFYLLGFGPLPWAVMAELLPPSAKGTAGALVSSSCWVLSFIATKCFQDLVDALGTAAAFFIFAGCSAAGAVFVFCLLPETKAKSLDQIQRELSTGFRAASAPS